MHTVRIKNIGQVITGKTPSTKRPELFGDSYPFITPSDIPSYDVFHVENTRRGLSEEGFRSQKNKILPPRTVCYVCIGSTVGKLCITKEASFTNQQLNSIVVDKENYIPEYVYYRLRYDTPRIQSIAGGTGSGKSIYNKTAFEEYELEIHDYETQRKIGGILSAYDELIENNNHRIKILEEMAQRIYREWFVDFRYPGHENDKLVDSELGMIPEGWEITSVSEAVELNPRLTVPKDTTKPYVPMAGLNPGSMLIVDYEMRTGNSGAKFQNGDTLMARITPSLEHGKTAFVQFLGPNQTVAIGSTEFNVMRSRTVNPYFVYCLARNKNLRECVIKSMVGASGRQRVQPECFDTFRFPHPCRSLLSLFAETVEPTFKLIQRLWEKALILRQIRDLLLPKIISGQIDVSELDIEIGDNE